MALARVLVHLATLLVITVALVVLAMVIWLTGTAVVLATHLALAGTTMEVATLDPVPAVGSSCSLPQGLRTTLAVWWLQTVVLEAPQPIVLAVRLAVAV